MLYGQQLSRIVAITRDQITVTDNTTVRLHLGATHIEIPEPLDALLIRFTSERRPYTGVGTPATTPWLFPGLDPGRTLTAYQLGQRLRRLGINPAAGRRSALAHLAAQLPAAMLAKLLNLAPTTAVRWVRAVGGDWTTYAAHIIHDRDHQPRRIDPPQPARRGLFDTTRTSPITSFARGVPTKVVSEHAQESFTMSRYQHVLPGMQADAARTFADLVLTRAVSARVHDATLSG